MAAAFLRECDDQAVDRRTHRRAAASQGAIDLGCAEVEVDTGGLEEGHLPEQPGDLVPPLVSPQPLKHLRHHDPAGADVVLLLQELDQCCLLGGGVAVQEVHPGGRVDQDPQRRPTRRRSSSRSPCHRSRPRSWSSPRRRLRRAYSRSASLITCVFVLPSDTFMALVSASSSSSRVVLMICLPMQIIWLSNLYYKPGRWAAKARRSARGGDLDRVLRSGLDAAVAGGAL